MYPPMEMEGATYYPKPMNCPMHILIYKGRQRSYRELPIRLFEFGTVYRFERSGVLNGLLRVRGITQDDAHIFCTPEQLAPELADLLAFVLRILRAFGLTEFEAELATRPEKFVGDPEEWDAATDALRHALETAGIPYVVAEGEGAFYAPKIDVHVRDAIGRRWQVSTLQVDFQEPQRFGMEYVGADNERHRPYMIHRALFGSIERFFAILLEHYAGAFPTWLAPVQVRVLPVRDDHEAYAEEVAASLRAAGHPGGGGAGRRAARGRVRTGKLEKLPYVLVVGDDDVRGGDGRGQLQGKRTARSRRPSHRLRRRPAGRDRDPRPVDRRSVSSLERLWAGWRREYIERASRAAPGRRVCVLRHPRQRPPRRGTHVVWRHPAGTAAAILNAYPYTQRPPHGDARRHVGRLRRTSRRRGVAPCGRGSPTPSGPSKRPTSPTASTWAPTSAGPPAPASPGTSTCTCCPAGRATRTS